MSLPEHQFVKPGTLAESLTALADAEDAKVMAGGTDVIFNMRGRLFTPKTVISIKDLAELRECDDMPDGGIRIGAACRLTDLVEHPGLGRRYPALRDGIRAVASRHVRNMATIGGNICLETRCWYTNQSAQWREARVPCFKTGGDICHVIKSSPICVALNNADTPPILIALGASLVVAGARSERRIDLDAFYRLDGIANTALAPGEIVIAVVVPPPPARSVFIKEAPRKGIDFSYGAIAASTGATGAGDARIVLGSFGTVPVVLRRPAEIVRRNGLSDETIEAAVAATREELGALNNLYTPAAYKRDLANALVRRALRRLREHRSSTRCASSSFAAQRLRVLRAPTSFADSA